MTTVIITGEEHAWGRSVNRISMNSSTALGLTASLHHTVHWRFSLANKWGVGPKIISHLLVLTHWENVAGWGEKGGKEQKILVNLSDRFCPVSSYLFPPVLQFNLICLPWLLLLLSTVFTNDFHSVPGVPFILSDANLFYSSKAFF